MERNLFTGSTNGNLRLHFNLKQVKDKEKLTQIMLVTTINGRRIRIYTQLRIEPKFWDKSCNRCKNHYALCLRDRNRLNQINKRLKHIEKLVNQADKELAEKGKYLSASAIRQLVKDTRPMEERNFQPLKYLHSLVKDYSSGLNRKGKHGIASTRRTYCIALKRLEEFVEKRKYPLKSFDDFDKKFFSDFTEFLYTHRFKKGNETKQYTQNTIINTLKVIKNLLHRAYDNEMTDNNYFQRVQTTLSSDASEQVYLEEKELRKLAKVKVTGQNERNILDMFMIACYTALRISDIQQLNHATIRDGVISLYQHKTKELVEIPILKEIAPLIAHYQKTGFPSINVCNANEVIKELAKRCGINETISYKEQRGGVTTIQTKPKWERVTFHTARRSCITNLYKRGYPVNYIMTLSGHRSIQAFQRYMRASSKEMMHSFVKLLKKESAL